MNYSIVAGGNGLIGRALVIELFNLGVPIIVLGSSEDIHDDLKCLSPSTVRYVRSKASASWVDELSNEIKTKANLEDAVFFNLAWRGKQKLVDGGISDQVKNISMSSDFVKLAEQLGVSKFISVGSIEEVLLQRVLSKGISIAGSKKINWYALAKTSAYMQSAHQAYLSKIDFCHARISIVIDKQLRTNKFVESSIKKIINKSGMPVPENKELCNISSAEEIARQLVAVANKGLNKAIYNLGTEYSDCLCGYFKSLGKIVGAENESAGWNYSPPQGLLLPGDFSIKRLSEDTEYMPNESTQSLLSDLAGVI
jgi:nucleoside-diphosphate-sugar epimerase